MPAGLFSGKNLRCMRKLANEELNRLSVQAFKEAEKIPVVVVLDNVRSLNNIGSVFRTSDAFMVERILLCGITATPPHKDIHKTALGATESVDWQYYPETAEAIEELKKSNYLVVAVEQTEGSVSLDRFQVRAGRSYAFVLGHEVRGVSQEIVDLADACLDIPQFGTKHSLNISVCAGMVIWEVFKQLKL
jgi:tRNA G18 (ribose-2'-O)-methylase SpoU